MSEPNLLHKRQIIRESRDDFKVNYSMDPPHETYCKEEYSARFVFPCKEATLKRPTPIRDKSEELKIELANIQLEESEALERHKTLTDHLSHLEILLENLLNYIECVILELKSSTRLISWLNRYEHIHLPPGQLKQLTDNNYDLSTIETFKQKLLTILKGNNDAKTKLKKLRGEFAERQSNYKLALKNFKIILEILNVNEDSLGKLKLQFEEVLMDYQRCRCILDDRELPHAIAEKQKLLREGLSFLGVECDMVDGWRETLRSFFLNFREVMRENAQVWVKEEAEGSRSSI
ncbi:uncharacterized protein LOC126736300 [Anthonomus grandis grandis]|uniref:uncharacterized protein LOC126736300 n=1 Tax=Anthonomus grandis grandis TaxID=2921223 RepID=UPI002165BD83|nr:uncharacterized protein LOC126736300 [Anthonomus grandis grandis]